MMTSNDSLIDSISQQNLIFWQELQQTLALLKKNDNQILDLHTHNLRKIEAIIICQTGYFDDIKQFRPLNQTLSSSYPYSWITPFFGDLQCKNYLFIHKDQVLLTTRSVGMTLSANEARTLKNAGLLDQFSANKIDIPESSAVKLVERNLVLTLG